MQIRTIEKEDLPQLAALYKQFWNEECDICTMQTQLEKLQTNDAYILLCAVMGGRLAGSVMGIVCSELYGSCQPFLVVENVIVDQSCRREGVGRALMCELENQAKMRGCSQMLLVTEQSRHDARAFYEALGFGTNYKGYKKKL